jgi:2-polyprenyl-6-methoxyphenol hydroxylase-like FAD-dependent oxidoreductase
MSVPSHTDVLVVGAGPAGLAMAASLAQLGVDHVVVDRAPAPSSGSRAAAVQPRTLEYLHRLGVAAPLIDDGLRGRGFVVADAERRLLRADYADIASPFPFLLLISQQQTEERLRERLEALGGRVHRGIRLLALQDEFPGTAATLVDQDGVLRVINARYVIGSDGLHSQVRAQLGVPFPGTAPEALFAVADVHAEGSPTAELDTTFTLSAGGMLISSPLPGGQIRLVAGVPPATAPLTAAELTALVEARGGRAMGGLRISDVVSSTTYRVQQRVAERMQVGNVFLVGDAAHTHSPAGGQGMNTGIQDAANLAWKIAAVLTGAPRGLLDTYGTERHPVAQQLIAFTSQLMAAATIADPRMAAVRNDVVAAAAAVPGVTSLLADRLAQLDIDYAERGADALAPGRRIDPALASADDLSWTILNPGDRAGDLPAGVTAVTAPVEHPVIVRPDGIVAETATAASLLGITIDTSPQGAES